jgi:4-amino-4-deoxy-L-arabinose transferase-like glycosyltransferase
MVKRYGRSFLSSKHGLLFVILLIALVLRLWGISFGLPYRYHPDEPQHVVDAARMLSEQRLEPAIFNNPPFYKYVLMAGNLFFVAWSLLSGAYSSISELTTAIQQDPSPLYLLGRVISALAGTLTVLVVYFLGSTAYSRRVGLLAALFLAVAYLPVRDSHYAVNDALLTLLVTLSLLASMLIEREGHLKWYIMAAVAAGLAFATKYTAIFVIVPLTIGHFLTVATCLRKPESLKAGKLVGAYCMVGVAAVAGSPYFLLKPDKVFDDIFRSIYSYGASGFEGWQIDSVSGYLFYLKSLSWGMGYPLLVLSILGVGYAVVRHRPLDLLLVSFPVLLYIFMGRQEMYFARFILPVIPVLLTFAALVVVDGVNKLLQKSGRSNMGEWVIAVVALLAILQPAVYSMRHNHLLTLEDTRTLSKQWIEANIPEGSKIAVDWPYHGPPLATPTNPDPYSVRTYNVITIGGNGISDHPIEYYQQNGFDYVIASSNVYRLSLADQEKDAQRKIFYSDLNLEFEEIYQLKPYTDSTHESPFIFDEVLGPAIDLWQRERPGPTIKVYRVVSHQP